MEAHGIGLFSECKFLSNPHPAAQQIPQLRLFVYISVHWMLKSRLRFIRTFPPQMVI